MSSARPTLIPVRSAWAGDPPLPGAARERLLAAAASCITRDGLMRTGIAAVAQEAGVSRPTVYRYFEDREALVQAALLDAGRALGDTIAEHLMGFRDPAEKAIEAVLFVLHEIPRDPVLREVWTASAIDTSAVQGITGPLAIGFCRDALRGLRKAAGWSKAEADECYEVMLRFVLSLLASPAPDRDESGQRTFLERRLVPALGLSSERSTQAKRRPAA